MENILDSLRRVLIACISEEFVVEINGDREIVVNQKDCTEVADSRVRARLRAFSTTYIRSY